MAKLIKGVNDLQTKYPEIAAEWHPTKNKDLKPDEVTCGSNRKVWWLGKCNHEWNAFINNRCHNQAGCPYCNGKAVLQGFNDLRTVYPKIAAEWHPTKNGNLTPDKVTKGSNKLYWWKCNKGHEWKTSISNRTSGDKTNCPYCGNKKLLQGFNDLQTVYPEIAAEWHPFRNGNLTPNNVLCGTHKKIWWKCDKGHEWSASVDSRIRCHSGCPICNHSVSTSFPEQCIVYYLSKEFLDVENNNRTVLGGKELDIFIPSISVAIEYDGSYWHQDEQEDIQKNILCKKTNVTLYRVRDIKCKRLQENKTVFIDDAHIFYVQSDNYNDLSVVIRKLCNCLNVNIDVNVERDTVNILKQYNFKTLENSLLNRYPNIAKEWNYERNMGMTPDMFSYGSSQKVWWKCDKGHEWQAQICSRTLKKTPQCPYCVCNVKNKSIMCIEIDYIFDNINDAAKYAGTAVSNIRRCCRGERKTAGGYHWKYVDEEGV